MCEVGVIVCHAGPSRNFVVTKKQVSSSRGVEMSHPTSLLCGAQAQRFINNSDFIKSRRVCESVWARELQPERSGTKRWPLPPLLPAPMTPARSQSFVFSVFLLPFPLCCRCARFQVGARELFSCLLYNNTTVRGPRRKATRVLLRTRRHTVFLLCFRRSNFQTRCSRL